MHHPAPTWQIEPALPDDIDRIDRIEQEAFTTPWSRDLLRAAITNRQYTVRVLRTEEAAVTGFYIAHIEHRRSNLDNLAVEPDLRNLGYGQQLLDDWLENCRREAVELAGLQVNTANRDAQRLYERYGFRTARLLVSYYPNGDDAYQMERRLRAPRQSRSRSRLLGLARGGRSGEGAS